MAADDDYPSGDAIYAPDDTPIDPVLQLHRSYVVEQPHTLPSLPSLPPLPTLPSAALEGDFEQSQSQTQSQSQSQSQYHQQQQQQQQEQQEAQQAQDQPAAHDATGPVTHGQGRASTDRDGFRPHEDPRPIIPPDIDTSRVDLTYRRNPRSHSANNPSPDGWLYPHKKGIGTGSNLEAFKDDIEARTLRGENCKTIAEALKALGVQTSDKAISRVRIKWGMRKRTQRKLKTPPPDSDAARLSAKTKIQTLRKMEITRMTHEGMTAEQIYDNLTSRGMELKKGVATVLRLQSAWRLTQNPKRWLENFRHQCHKKAKAQQVQAFKDIAKELAVDDLDAWLEAKLSEQPVREARHELAIKMMGDHAPTVNRRKLQARRGETRRGDGSDSDDEEEEEEEEDWEDSLSHSDDNEQPNEDGSIYPNLDPDPNSPSVPMADQVDVDRDDHGDDPGSAASVSARVFASMGQTIPRPADSPHPAQKKRPRPSTTTSATPPSRSSPSTGHKRLKGRPAKPQPTPSALHEAPIANMTPAPDPEAPASSSQQPDTQTTAVDAVAAVAAPAAHAPSLVLRPEEADANRAALSTLDQYHAAAQAYKEILQARNDNKPLAGSLTGLPPSAKDLELAKRKLKEVNQALMLNLE